MPRPHFSPGERPGTHCTDGWVGPRAGLDGQKISLPLEFDPWTAQTVVSRYTDWATRPMVKHKWRVIIIVNICQCCHAVFQTISTAGEYTTMQAATSFFSSNSDLLPFCILMKDPNPYNLTNHICVNILLMILCTSLRWKCQPRAKATSIF
jgi:hypothetical protein